MSQAFYDQFYDAGREARFKAELTAAQTNTAVQLPLFTHHPTGRNYWRNGWNSVHQSEIINHITDVKSQKTVRRLPLNYIDKARKIVSGES